MTKRTPAFLPSGRCWDKANASVYVRPNARCGEVARTYTRINENCVLALEGGKGSVEDLQAYAQ